MTGFIGVGQLKYILTNLGEKMTDEEVDELLKAVDTSSGQVNYTGKSLRIVESFRNLSYRDWDTNASFLQTLFVPFSPTKASPTKASPSGEIGGFILHCTSRKASILGTFFCIGRITDCVYGVACYCCDLGFVWYCQDCSGFGIQERVERPSMSFV